MGKFKNTSVSLHIKEKKEYKCFFECFNLKSAPLMFPQPQNIAEKLVSQFLVPIR